MKDLLKRYKQFLKYLEEHQENIQQRSWPSLERKFGKKQFDELRDFCLTQHYLRNIPIEKDKGRHSC